MARISTVINRIGGDVVHNWVALTVLVVFVSAVLLAAAAWLMGEVTLRVWLRERRHRMPSWGVVESANPATRPGSDGAS